MPEGARFEQTLPAGHNAFVYVYRGEVRIAGKAVPLQRMAILANTVQADGVVIEASADAKLDFGGGPTAQRAHRAVRPLCDEHQGRDLPGLAGFPRRTVGEKA